MSKHFNGEPSRVHCIKMFRRPRCVSIKESHFGRFLLEDKHFDIYVWLLLLFDPLGIWRGDPCFIFFGVFYMWFLFWCDSHFSSMLLLFCAYVSLCCHFLHFSVFPAPGQELFGPSMARVDKTLRLCCCFFVRVFVMLFVFQEKRDASNGVTKGPLMALVPSFDGASQPPQLRGAGVPCVFWTSRTDPNKDDTDFWLVVWDLFYPYTSNFITTDELIFFRGGWTTNKYVDFFQISDILSSHIPFFFSFGN